MAEVNPEGDKKSEGRQAQAVAERRPEYNVSGKGDSSATQPVDRFERFVCKPLGENTVDSRAQKIIDDATDKSKGSLEQRGVRSVQQILDQYYGRKDVKVEWDPKVVGLRTDGPGKITVGEEYVKRMSRWNFADRVTSVGHELEHFKQYKDPNLSGKDKGNEREFLAKKWSASAVEKPGTGFISIRTRVGYIDGALALLEKTPGLEEKYRAQKEELIKYREFLEKCPPDH
jgi:hypothetical protein